MAFFVSFFDVHVTLIRIETDVCWSKCVHHRKRANLKCDTNLYEYGQFSKAVIVKTERHQMAKA